MEKPETQRHIKSISKPLMLQTNYKCRTDFNQKNNAT